MPATPKVSRAAAERVELVGDEVELRGKVAQDEVEHGVAVGLVGRRRCRESRAPAARTGRATAARSTRSTPRRSGCRCCRSRGSRARPRVPVSRASSRARVPTRTSRLTRPLCQAGPTSLHARRASAARNTGTLRAEPQPRRAQREAPERRRRDDHVRRRHAGRDEHHVRDRRALAARSSAISSAANCLACRWARAAGLAQRIGRTRFESVGARIQCQPASRRCRRSPRARTAALPRRPC